MRRHWSLVILAMGFALVGCSNQAAQIPESTVKFDSARDKVELGGIGGSGGGLPRKGGGSNTATNTQPK